MSEDKKDKKLNKNLNSEIDKKSKNKKEKKPKLTKQEKKEQKGSFGERFSLKFRKRLIANRARTILLVVILVLAFIAINLWARSKATSQIDLTKNKVYTLSQSSKDQLSSLDKDVMIYIYGYDDSSSYVTFIKQYAEFNDHIKYEIVTTETNYEVISKYKLDEKDYSAFVVTCGERDEILYPDREFSTQEYSSGSYVNVDLTEQSITNAILKVSAENPTKIYFVSGHGETVLSDVSTLKSDLEDVVYECEDLNMISISEIPEDCNVLVILNPASDYSESEAEMVKNYIRKGGNLFVTMYKENSSASFPNFQSILDLYGASVEYGLLYETSNRNYYQYPYYIIPEVSESDEITSNMANSGYYALMPLSQNIVSNEVNEENVTVNASRLLYTSSSCYNITDESTINQGLSLDNLSKDSYNVAEKFTREMGNEEDTKITSTLILVGNNTFLKDSYGYYTFPANQTFTLNCFASLADQGNLITVRKISSSGTAFTKTATSFSDLVVRAIIFGVPIIIIVAGVVVGIVRKRKR